MSEIVIRKSLPPSPKSAAELEEYTWRTDTIPRMEAAGLDRRFHQRLDFADNRRQKQVYQTVWKTCCGSGAIVALVGIRGTGKTSIAAQIIRNRAETVTLPPWERQPPYRKLCDLTARFKSIYGDFGSLDVEAVMRSRAGWVSVSLHVIDEIGECEDMRLSHRILTDLVDRCYAARTDVILISNQTVQQFQQTTSDSILSRLHQHGKIIECDWQSFRSPKTP